MNSTGKIIIHIPAREGSKRVPKKNIRNMAGKPMISYAIDAALNSEVSAEIYVNTDSKDIIQFVENNYQNVKIYTRNKDLASDTATSDQFNYDIIKSLNPDTLIMVNPVCPLITSSDISEVFKTYQNSNCDTLITCEATRMQTFSCGQPVNINIDEQLRPSQDNKEIQILNWAVTIWDAKLFQERYESLGYAVMGDNRILHNIDHSKSFKVSEENDFEVCELLLKIRKNEI